MSVAERVSILRARRQALASHNPSARAFLFSGGARPRNYRGNTYPFRADSHFLYFAGQSLADSVLCIEGERAVLYRPRPTRDDALWHGPALSIDALKESTGVDEVRDLESLTQDIAGGGSRVTLPSQDPRTLALQARLLERPWLDLREEPVLSPGDEQLANAVVELRMRHDAGALLGLRKAAEATTAAHLAGMAITRPGLYEHDVRAAMEGTLFARGMVTSYQPIVTVHGEVLHSNDYSGPIDAGDLLLADVGAEYEGWAGDVTRTWPVSGKYSPQQRRAYEIVLAAQLAAIEGVRSGARYRDLHLRAARVIAEGLVDLGVLRGKPEDLVARGAHALFFPHGLGHLLGLDVHDMEDLGDRAGYAAGRLRSSQFGLSFLRLDRDLEPGMVVTIEPGIYVVPAILEDREICGPFDADGTLNRSALDQLAGVRGIRIEDDVLCTEGAPEVLTKDIPKTVEEVEAAVGPRESRG